MTAHDDLATLRQTLAPYPTIIVALDRLEAELARLREQRDEARSEAAEQKDALDRAYQARDDGWREVLDKHYQTGDYIGLGIWAQDNVPQLLAALADMRRALEEIASPRADANGYIKGIARRALAATEETA